MLSFASSLFFLCAQTHEGPPPPPPPPPEPETEEIFTVKEKMPVFPGCEDEDMDKTERKECAEGNKNCLMKKILSFEKGKSLQMYLKFKLHFSS